MLWVRKSDTAWDMDENKISPDVGVKSSSLPSTFMLSPQSGISVKYSGGYSDGNRSSAVKKLFEDAYPLQDDNDGRDQAVIDDKQIEFDSSFSGSTVS